MRIPPVITRAIAAALLALSASCTPPREAPDTVVIWHQKTGAERSFFEKVVREYNALHPQGKIDALYREGEELRNSFIIAAVAGQGPDLVFGPADNVGLFAETRVIRPWNESLDKAFLDRFTADGIVSWKGKPWMVADQIGNQLMLVYDRQAVKSPPRTLAELVESGRTLTRREGDAVTRHALAWNTSEPYFFIPFLTGFGGWILDDEGNPSLDTPEMRAALGFVVDLREKYGLTQGYADYDEADLAFKHGRAAMTINGPWSWAEYGVPDRSMLALLPLNTATGLHCRPLLAAKGYCMNINTPAAKFGLIRDVLRHLTGEAVQREMAARLFTTPTLESVIHSPAVANDPVLRLAIEQAKLSLPAPVTPKLRYIWDGMRAPYRKVMTGELSPDQGARLMQREVDRLLAEGMP